MSAFRTLAGLLYRRPIPLFDRLNANVQFRQAVRTLHGAPQFQQRQAMYEWIHRERVSGTPLTYRGILATGSQVGHYPCGGPLAESRSVVGPVGGAVGPCRSVRTHGLFPRRVSDASWIPRRHRT
jgi:hypothetical protein